ncbi:MAG: VWA domain-containing protein [Patescibacteria group bacterium]
MGRGEYSHEAHRASTRQRAALSKEEVFKQTKCHDDMNPFGLIARESRDSENHPDSVSIIMALDQTGSMGGIPDRLARETFPDFMKFVQKVLADPQLMFMAVGDAGNHELAPLQVGQFESEGQLMDHWLTSMYLEGNGGGNGRESYELPLFIAARHVVMDCWEKRRRKGYMFITGDEKAYEAVSPRVIRTLVGTQIETITIQQLVAEVLERWHLFFLIPDPDRYNYAGCGQFWRSLIGDCTITMGAPEDTSVVSATLVGLTEGEFADLDTVSAKLHEMGYDGRDAFRVIRAVEPYAASIGFGGDRRGAERAEPPSGKGKGRNRLRN